MKKAAVFSAAFSAALALGAAAFSAVRAYRSKQEAEDFSKKGYDLSVPVLNQNGWYMVFEDDFDGEKLNQGIRFGEKYKGGHEIWTTAPHAVRWQSDCRRKPEQACYWCPQTVEVKDSNAVIHARAEQNHTCPVCPSAGNFTGGIETRRVRGDGANNKGDADEILFAQAFGYFECRAKLPDCDGLWSAFWLQASSQRLVGNAGEDGTEIDIFESAFRKSRHSKMGHALLWDGYGKDGKVKGHIVRLPQNLYDGYHTYALKWTPAYYVFYIDGTPTFATDAGGVSKVREFLRLTVEIDAGDGWGPHGQRIGRFKNSADSDFKIDYVKVWQNEAFESAEKDISEFTGRTDWTD